MTTYARLDPLTMLVRDTVELTPEQYAALNGNPKQAFIRPMVIDAQPTPTAAQRVGRGPYVVEPNQVRQTWVLSEKTAEEIAAEVEQSERLADLAQIRTVLAAMKAGTGTTTVRLQRLEAVVFRLAKDAAQ